MCGIAALIGNVPCYKYIIYALKMLQNRGYDSAGICAIDNNNFIINKYASTKYISAIEKLQDYEKMYDNCNICIGHCRWATTGIVSDNNSHPHIDHKNRFAIIHNGIIENYATIKNDLIENYNVTFKSETDTEVIVNLVSFFFDSCNDVEQALTMALNKIEGTWGIVLIDKFNPDKLYCARHGSPLLIGFAENYTMISSEQSGFYPDVKKYIVLNNHDIFIVKKNISETKINSYPINIINIDNNIVLSPAPYKYWTIKEIYEQPDAIYRAFGCGGRIVNNNYVKLGGLINYISALKNINNLVLLGCGTSFYSGLYCISLFKQLCTFNTVQIFDGAEFTSSDIPKIGSTVFILISQSGETKDLHRCLDIAKQNNIFTIGVINTVDSLISREVNCGVYINAGKEHGVASTKSFTSQIIVLYLIAIWFSQIHNNNQDLRLSLLSLFNNIPTILRGFINNVHNTCKNIAQKIYNNNSLFILGKNNCEAIAKEGALKIKEISYIHAEGYSSSSLKHGSYALITDQFPVFINVPNDEFFNRNVSIINELKSRNAFIILITNTSFSNADYCINIPFNYTYFFGIFASVVYQLIAFEIALIKGHNPDFPKNLAKVITVD